MRSGRGLPTTVVGIESGGGESVMFRLPHLLSHIIRARSVAVLERPPAVGRRMPISEVRATVSRCHENGG